jgi:bifunctional non-homologous end joining protein LigD
MLLLRTDRLPEGPDWLYELKLDGYRALGAKVLRESPTRSRNDNDFNSRYPGLVEALGSMPDETVIEGEIVALDGEGRLSFNALQNRGPGEPLHFFIFDLLILRGRDVMAEPLVKRRALIEKHLLPTLADPIRYSPILEASLPNLIRSVKEQGLEGLVAKRRDSKYESGERSGAWAKMRVNQAQDFIIGGYTVGGATFDALIFGYHDGTGLLYAGRTRSGYTPPVREALMRRFRGLEISECPFSNLPEARSGRWSEGLTAAKMKNCRWLKPVLVARFEFVEWTPDKHFRHSRFVGLRDDKKASEIPRENHSVAKPS